MRVVHGLQILVDMYTESRVYTLRLAACTRKLDHLLTELPVNSIRQHCDNAEFEAGIRPTSVKVFHPDIITTISTEHVA